jgi:hypothetical protein
VFGEEDAIHMSLAPERMVHENHILRQGMFGIQKKDLELQVVYHCLSEAEHGLNHTRT